MTAIMSVYYKLKIVITVIEIKNCWISYISIWMSCAFNFRKFTL